MVNVDADCRNVLLTVVVQELWILTSVNNPPRSRGDGLEPEWPLTAVTTSGE